MVSISRSWRRAPPIDGSDRCATSDSAAARTSSSEVPGATSDAPPPPLRGHDHASAPGDEQRAAASWPRDRWSIGLVHGKRQRVRVRGVGGRHCHGRSVRVGGGGAKRVDGRRRRELRTRESAHEIAAPHLAAQLEPPELAVDQAPGYGGSLAPPPVARDDAVAIQPLPRDRLGARLVVLGAPMMPGVLTRDQRPTQPSRPPGKIGPPPLRQSAKVRTTLHDRTTWRRREVRRKPAGWILIVATDCRAAAGGSG